MKRSSSKRRRSASTKGGRGNSTAKPKLARKSAPPAVRRINLAYKGIAVALQPAADALPSHLSERFRVKLEAALAALSDLGFPFRLVEGFRTTDRQQWLYGSGRPDVQPYGRVGRIITNADGVLQKSKHQGDGKVGSGLAADCYPLKGDKVYVPPATDPVWEMYARSVETQGLVAGQRWPRIRDSPHCEVP
jgi:hypothetical protein